MELPEILRQLRRSSVRLTIEGDAGARSGCSRFGGVPDVPREFVWPFYETDTYDDETVKPRPLAFLAQIDCASLPEAAGEIALPKTGVLSFFYEVDSMKWGFDPKDAGCARVFWFEDAAALSPVNVPEELPEAFRFPAIGMELRAEENYPDYEDLAVLQPDVEWDDYDAALEALGFELPDNCSKLLGWPNIIQSNMTIECEMVSRGYYMGGGDELPQDALEAAQRTSGEEWLLLFQLDTVEQDGFELMFGDCGRLYFYIRKEDLACRRFDRVWLILQCG